MVSKGSNPLASSNFDLIFIIRSFLVHYLPQITMKKLNSQFVGTGQTKNRTGITQPNQNELKVIKGFLTSRIETKNKNGETYAYGFFQIEGQEPEIPVIFKTKPDLIKGSQVE